MNGMQKGIAEAMNQLLQSNHSLIGSPSTDENATYVHCRNCRSRIDRMYIAPLNRYVFPICICWVRMREAEQAAFERHKRRGELERVFRHSMMNDNLKQARFGNFIRRSGTEAMYEQTVQFANQIDSQKNGLLGYGSPGNGKSHLFASIHHSIYERGYFSFFLDSTQLFNTTDQARRYSSQTSINEIISAACSCDLLTLDELGAGKLTQDDYTDVLFPIINGRQGKLTNYTTNLDLDELYEWLLTDKYGKPLDAKGRLIDRIIGASVIVENTGQSYRMEQAMNRKAGAK